MENCDWRIHASRLEENYVFSSNWLCKHLSEHIAANPKVPVETLQKLAWERIRIKVKKRLSCKVKGLAERHIHEGSDKAYSLLPRYAENIKEANHVSYALVNWRGNNGNMVPKFKACFFAFAIQVKGFVWGCRAIIYIDGAHLSGYSSFNTRY